MSKKLSTTRDVVRALGGHNAVVNMLDGVSYNNVCNWIIYNRFPPKSYAAIKEALRRRRLSASDTLWPMIGLR